MLIQWACSVLQFVCSRITSGLKTQRWRRWKTSRGVKQDLMCWVRLSDVCWIRIRLDTVLTRGSILWFKLELRENAAPWSHKLLCFLLLVLHESRLRHRFCHSASTSDLDPQWLLALTSCSWDSNGREKLGLDRLSSLTRSRRVFCVSEAKTGCSGWSGLFTRGQISSSRSRAQRAQAQVE